jgi:hypothetical protein
MQEKTKFTDKCICFPSDREPFFLYPGLQQLAFQVKCPFHGDRFVNAKEFEIGMEFEGCDPRELEVGFYWRHADEQYRKAWNASFTGGSWPVEEIVQAGRTWLLPRSPEGELMDWENLPDTAPWKRVKAYTIETHDLSERETGPVENTITGTGAKRRARSPKDEEALALLEEFGCKES